MLLIHKITGKVGSGGAFSFILVAMMLNQISTFHCGKRIVRINDSTGFVQNEVQGEWQISKIP